MRRVEESDDMKSWRAIGGLAAAGMLLVINLTVAAQGGPPQAPGGGGGGRGPLPGSLIWADKCAGCHGTATEAGRAPRLFDDAWLARWDDAKITSTIENGVQGTEMPAFAATLNDLQVFQLIQHIRTQSAIARPAPAFVANPHGIVVPSQKQKFRFELVADGLMTPFALAFLPDGRLLVTERDGRLRIIHQGKLSDL